MEAAVPADRLTAALESVLFVAPDPVPVSTLARTVGWPVRAVIVELSRMSEEFQERGIRLQWTQDAVQLTTDPEAAPVVQRFLGVPDDAPLSRAALETLAIIAFKQPVTRGTIEKMRRSSADYTLGKLRDRDLIEEVGRAEGAGRPVLYGTTFRFLEHFGLGSLDELALPEPAADEDEAAPEDFAAALAATAAA
jgi:segregation and condensation protein B